MGETTTSQEDKKIESNSNDDNNLSDHDNIEIGDLQVQDIELDENESDADLTQAEYEALDNQLNSLNDALDAIETKRDNLHEQMMALLEVNRAMRNELFNLKTCDTQNDNSTNKS